MPATLTEVQQLNAAIFESLAQGSGREKYAADAITDFTRTRMREDGFFRKILPPLQVSNDDMSRQVDTDMPVVVVDKEPDSPAAISVPFATLPTSLYIRGPRYRVMFARILTPRFTKDVDELRTWTMDIRQVLSDNAIKDMLAEEDSKFLGAVNTALVAPNTAVPWSGIPQWVTLQGGIVRDTWQDARKVMPRTNAHLEAKTALVNNVTIKEFEKWTRDEMGGDFSQDVLKNSWAEATLSGVKLIITIKRDLVPDNSMYMFADEKFIGKSFTLEDTVMYVKRDFYMLEFFAYQTLGSTLGHSAGLVRVDFQ
jgi:hypothetical protein